MKRLSFTLALTALISFAPMVGAEELKGVVILDTPEVITWQETPVGSDDRGRFARFLVDDHRFYQDSIGFRNRDFENWKVDSFNPSANMAMRHHTRGLARVFRDSDGVAVQTTAGRRVYVNTIAAPTSVIFY